jgi:metal-sulfur cluster biosynthetic enzyme
MSALLNANPIVYNVAHDPLADDVDDDVALDGAADEATREWVTAGEVFGHIRNINDPEHPLTLEQLNVVSLDSVVVADPGNRVTVRFTPTIPHCSMATLIGLCIRVKLYRSLPSRFKVLVEISPGTHNTENEINKQLADKERVAAALENSHLLDVVNRCIAES